MDATRAATTGCADSQPYHCCVIYKKVQREHRFLLTSLLCDTEKNLTLREQPDEWKKLNKYMMICKP